MNDFIYRLIVGVGTIIIASLLFACAYMVLYYFTPIIRIIIIIAALVGGYFLGKYLTEEE